MKFLCTVLACSLIAGCGDDDGIGGFADSGVVDANAGRRLVILATNDGHSHLFAFGPEIDDFPAQTEPGSGDIVGGAARRATVFEQERAAAASAGYDTITVSSGDQNFGALPQVSYDTTAPDFQIMQALGYDVMCPGRGNSGCQRQRRSSTDRLEQHSVRRRRLRRRRPRTVVRRG